MIRKIAPFLLAIFLFLAINSVFIIKETERAIIWRFGKAVSSADAIIVYSPGFHFKIPFIDDVKKIDSRLRTSIMSQDKVPTIEQIYLEVNLFVKWKVSDFNKFIISNRGNNLQSRNLDVERKLTDKVKNTVLSEFGRMNIEQVVTENRRELMEKFIKSLGETSRALGIEIIDVRLKRIDLPAEVSAKVYERMSSERQKVAEGYRARGREEAEVIKANTDAEIKITIAEAQKYANEKEAEGKAIASNIFLKAYSQDEDFYKFLISLESYKESFKDKNDVFVLKPDSEFFEVFKKGK